MPRNTSTTTAIEKVCKLLICMTDPDVRRLKDITDKTGIDRASALRVLDCLIDYELVEREEDSKEYRYGKQVYVIASALRPRLDLAKIAEPSLRRLARLSGDSVQLLVRQGSQSVCVGREVGDWHIRAGTIQLGTRRALGLGAGGLALMAWLPDEEVDFLLFELAEQIEAHPGAGEQYLRREIEAARRRGHTLMLDTMWQGVGAIGVPVRDELGTIVGAISISSVTQRVADREHMLATALKKEVGIIAAALQKFK